MVVLAVCLEIRWLRQVVRIALAHTPRQRWRSEAWMEQPMSMRLGNMMCMA